MKLTKKYRFFEAANGIMPDPLHDYQNSVTYHYNDKASEYDSCSEVVAKIVDNNEFEVAALPDTWIVTDGGYL